MTVLKRLWEVPWPIIFIVFIFRRKSLMINYRKERSAASKFQLLFLIDPLNISSCQFQFHDLKIRSAKTISIWFPSSKVNILVNQMNHALFKEMFLIRVIHLMCLVNKPPTLKHRISKKMLIFLFQLPLVQMESDESRIT